MNQILANMALMMLTEFCVANNINCSGTYVKKEGRGFTYSLRDQETGQRQIASITFHKSQVPTFTV